MKKKFNIILKLKHPEILKSQMPIDDNDIDFHFNNMDKSILWDLVIFFNAPSKEYSFNIINGSSIFITGEPKLMLRYSKSFLKQFKFTVTPYKINKKNHYQYPPYIPWFYGVDFKNKKLNYNISDLRNMEPLRKTKVISVITSQKNFMPGHVKRLKFIDELKKRFKDKIDFYGKDSLELNDKSEGINDYKFHICFENSSCENYWTEKLSDPILGFSIPIYYGCNNIDSFFKSGIIKIDLDNIETSLDTVNDILNNSDSIYSEMKNDLILNRNKILNDQNLISFCKNFYFDKVFSEKIDVKKVRINHFRYFKMNYFLNKVLRVKRLLLKINLLK